MQIAIVDDSAEDRENFLKAAAQVNFQLVFMDIYMENMDGIFQTHPD